MNDICYMILSHERARTLLTYNTLLKMNVNKSDVYIVIDDFNEQIDAYKKLYKNVLIFNKEREQELTDTFDNGGNMSVVLFARNYAIRKSKELEYNFVVLLDDDVQTIYYKTIKGNKLITKKCCENVFDKIVSYMKCNKMIDMCSLGNELDYIGGVQGLVANGINRKANNVFIIRTKTDIRFQSRFNEDINTIYCLNEKGKIIFDISMLQVKCKQTGKARQDGGMKDAYKQMSDYLKCAYSLLCMPNKVTIKVNKNGKINMQKKFVPYDYI